MTHLKINIYNQDVISLSFSHTNKFSKKNTTYILRLLQEEDIPSLVSIRCMKPVWKLNGDIEPPQPSEVEKHLKTMLFQRKKDDSIFPLTLLTEKKKEKIIGFFNIKSGFRCEDRQLSYYISPGKKLTSDQAAKEERRGYETYYKNWGIGLGTAAAKIASEFAMLFHARAPSVMETEEGIKSRFHNSFTGIVAACCFEDNYASQNILRKIGMKLCPHQELDFRNELEGMHYFELK